MTRPAPWRPSLRDGKVLLALAVGSLSIGWTLNRIRPDAVPIPYVPRKPVVVSGDLTLAEFSALTHDATALVLDARPGIFYELGHVPGALSLPEEDFAAAFPRFRDRLESARVVAVYCADPDCEDARQLQSHLTARGVANVAVYPDGWQGWSGAHRPAEKSAR
ncbi:MAG TPA: rhodanese-like domain-containing protein [Opitutaceae bacterium]|jgi:rhodanese-related sulfurtransferase